MTRSLPERPSLENLKKQAKALLKSHRAADPGVCAVLRKLHRFSHSSDSEILSSTLTLAEAQYALAMDYGFASWNALKECVEGQQGQTRFLHMQCGDYSAESLRRSGVPGKVIVWYDPFTEGPVPAEVTGDEWFETRAEVVQDRFPTLSDAISFFREMYARFAEFRGYEEVVLWFDACLFDQTIMICHLDWFSQHNLGATKLSLICVGEFPGMPRFKGLGELRPEQMATLLERRHEVTKAEMELATQAWNAYRSPDPTAIERLLARDTSALPYIASALRRHLERFPSVRNGLDRAEQAAFEVIAQGHTAYADIFFRVSDLEDPPYFGDTMLLNQLVCLSEGPVPLLEMQGSEFTEGLPRHEWPLKSIGFHLTEAGRSVMECRADRVQLRGIDQWLGGVHLHGAESQWRWNAEEEMLVRG